MSELTPDERGELLALRARVEALERERIEQLATAHAALGAAQERLYWLDRWHLDLNALMARPGAAEFRAVVRAVREVMRVAKLAKRKLIG